MFSEAAIAEFADKYSDHVVFTASAGSGTVLAGIWHILPVELVALITAALFITARVCVERWLHARRDRKKHVRTARASKHPAKRRIHV